MQTPLCNADPLQRQSSGHFDQLPVSPERQEAGGEGGGAGATWASVTTFLSEPGRAGRRLGGRDAA